MHPPEKLKHKLLTPSRTRTEKGGRTGLTLYVRGGGRGGGGGGGGHKNTVILNRFIKEFIYTLKSVKEQIVWVTPRQ